MQWHQLDYMQTMCTLLQTDNHTNTSSLNFYRPDALPDILRTVSKHWRAQCSPHSSLNRCPQPPEWVGIDRHDKYVSKRPCGSCWLSASERPCLRGSFVMLPGSQFSVTPHTHGFYPSITNSPSLKCSARDLYGDSFCTNSSSLSSSSLSPHLSNKRPVKCKCRDGKIKHLQSSR